MQYLLVWFIMHVSRFITRTYIYIHIFFSIHSIISHSSLTFCYWVCTIHHHHHHHHHHQQQQILVIISSSPSSSSSSSSFFIVIVIVIVITAIVMISSRLSTFAHLTHITCAALVFVIKPRIMPYSRASARMPLKNPWIMHHWVSQKRKGDGQDWGRLYDFMVSRSLSVHTTTN